MDNNMDEALIAAVFGRETLWNPSDELHRNAVPYMAQIPLIRKLRLRSRIQDLILNELESL
jgi:hypothetical protein